MYSARPLNKARAIRVAEMCRPIEKCYANLLSTDQEDGELKAVSDPHETDFGELAQAIGFAANVKAPMFAIRQFCCGASRVVIGS